MSQYARGRRRQRNPFGRWLLIIGVIVVVVIIAQNALFGVSNIEVQGNYYVTDAEVIASSGIKKGDSIFGIDVDQVRVNIDQNRYLQFVGLWRNYFPTSVIITVSEHTPRAKMAWMGMLVIIGENGIVLEQTAQIDTDVQVPEIIGMTASQVRVGQPVTYSIPGQGEAIDNIIDELAMQGIGNVVSQINIASPESMFLVTEDGLHIAIGNDDQLPEKFALIREVLPRIQTMGSVNGGWLDVSTAKTADYRKPK